MSDTTLYDLVQDIQHNGIRWVSIIAIYSLIRKERRNHLLNKRDEANFHNQQIVMKALGVGDQWKDGPRLGLQQMALPSLRKLSNIFCKATLKKKSNYPRRKNMNALKSTKFWLAIIGAIIPVINSEVGLHLDPSTILGILGLFATAIAGIAHVDGKKATAQTTPEVPSDPNKFIQP